MRVIGGTWGGRRLLGPPRGATARPTTDGVREAVFNVLGGRVQGARVLDLFAGTGALGVEALSRGAVHATFIEADRGLCQTVSTNLQTVECPRERFAVHCTRVRNALRKMSEPFDLVFMDPPYGQELEVDALAILAERDLVAPGGLVVVEHSSRAALQLPASAGDLFARVDQREYGDTAVTLYERVAPAAQPEITATSQGRTAVYAGSFDPPTCGHVDIIRRASALFDHLVVAVAGNVRKNALFTPEERVELLREVLRDDPRVEVERIDGLLVDYARQRGATAIVRGLRAVGDFEYEFQMACMNHHLAPTVETVFLMTAQEYFYVSSSLVKEVATFGGDVTPFLPEPVRLRLAARLAQRTP